MSCSTINPKWTSTGILKKTATILEDGSILSQTNEKERDFMIEIIESDSDYQEEVVSFIYTQTQRIILLVRDRLEREQPIIEFINNNQEVSEHGKNL